MWHGYAPASPHQTHGTSTTAGQREVNPVNTVAAWAPVQGAGLASVRNGACRRSAGRTPAGRHDGIPQPTALL